MKSLNNITISIIGPKVILIIITILFIIFPFFLGVLMGGQSHIRVLRNDGTLCAEIK